MVHTPLSFFVGTVGAQPAAELVAQDEKNVWTLNMLAQCYYIILADAFLPKKEQSDAHAKGQEYGERSLRTSAEFVRVEQEKGFVDTVVPPPTSLPCSGPTRTGGGRSSWVGRSGSSRPALRGDDKKLLALIERCLELDRGYIGGAPVRALAGYWAQHPFRKKPEETRKLLEEAIATYPEYLENRLFYAQYYLIPTEKWAQAREERQRVIDAPLGAYPLYNGFVKAQALALLGQLPN